MAYRPTIQRLQAPFKECVLRPSKLIPCEVLYGTADQVSEEYLIRLRIGTKEQYRIYCFNILELYDYLASGERIIDTEFGKCTVSNESIEYINNKLGVLGLNVIPIPIQVLGKRALQEPQVSMPEKKPMLEYNPNVYLHTFNIPSF